MSDPRCNKCGLEITTGMMAALCPRALECEFWPHSDGTPVQDGAELFMARAWIRNALDQIGMQIADRQRLSAEVERLKKAASGPDPLAQVLNEGDGVYRP